jgi:hypothetical protein
MAHGTARASRSLGSWRARTRTPNDAPKAASVVPARPQLATGSTDAFLASLPHFRKFMGECEEARELVAEASSGTARRVALHLFFESCDAALRDMEREERDVARGVAEFSPHQPNTATVVRIMRGHCARLVVMRHARRFVVRHADGGFFCAFLAVLDALLLAPPGLEVQVDWRLSGNEQHFTYTPPSAGQCVWHCLFDAITRNGDASRAPNDDATALEFSGRFNFYLVARFRGFFTTSAHCQLMRQMYHDVYAKYVRPSHPELCTALSGLGSELRAGVCIGVHKRVDTPGTVEYAPRPHHALGARTCEPHRRAACSLQRAACSLQLAACSLQLAACGVRRAARTIGATYARVLVMALLLAGTRRGSASTRARTSSKRRDA